MLVWLVGGYLLLIAMVGMYASTRVKDEEDYVVAGRKLPLSLAWATLLATWFGAATMTGAAENARESGIQGVILDPFAAGMSLIVAGLFFAKPLWEMKLLTLGDFYAQKYGPKAEFVASLIMVPSYFGWIAGQFVALASMQQAFLGIDKTTGIFIAAAFVLFYTLSGGMWSVTLTDALQIVIALVTLVVLANVTFRHLGNGSTVSGIQRLFRETPPDKLAFLPDAATAAVLAWSSTWFSGMLGFIPGQDLMQRVFASKSSSVAVRACLLAGVVYILFGLLPVGMGLASVILVPEKGAGSIISILAHEFLTPTLSAVFVVSLISIIVSTATSAVLSPATVLAHNLLGHIPYFHERALATTRMAVVVVTAGSIGMAFTNDSVLALLEETASMLLVGLFVPLVMGLYGRPEGERSAIWSILCGIVVWLVLRLGSSAWPMLGEAAALFGVLGSFAGYFVGRSQDRVRLQAN